MEGMRASVPVEVNGKPTRFWLDSGAWFSTMSEAKADELGLHADLGPAGLTMNAVGGSFTPKIAEIKDFSVNGSMVHNIDFVVGGSDPGNGLIGRSLIANNDLEFDIAHGAVKLIRATQCGNVNMAYWAAGKPYFTVKLLPDRGETTVHDLNLPIVVNGHTVTAVIDSGAITVMGRDAAEAAGIDLNGPGVVPMGDLGGLGRHTTKAWRVRVDSVAIGDETILNTTLTVLDGPITPGPGSPQMLLGMDFLLAHHVYISRSQHLIFFTYSGGSVFYKDPNDIKLASIRTPVAAPVGSKLVVPLDHAEEPKSAEEYARRGSARMAKKDVTGAISDFTKAIGLEPEVAANYRSRADAYFLSGDLVAARADMDHALKITPNDPDLILARGWQRRHDGDDIGALADADASRKLTPKGSLQGVSIAALYFELGQDLQAIAIYDDLIETHPQDKLIGLFLNRRCWVRALAGIELDAALADCNRSIKAEKSAAVLDSRALVEFRQRNFAAALADYDAALALDPNLTWSHYMRGQTRIALGQVEAGKTERDAAFANDPKVAERARRYELADAPASR
ncbi:MAG: aspartyl protease family protein [Novosphingobium sp.]